MEDMESSNLGRIPFQFGCTSWKMTASDPVPTGSEFELFVETLESFLEGFFYSKNEYEVPVYCRGDFMNERTEAIFISEPNFDPDELDAALTKWLDVPKRSSWRVLFPERDIVLYSPDEATPDSEEAEQGGADDADEAL